MQFNGVFDIINAVIGLIEFFALYVCAVSLVAVIMTVSDKNRARKGKRRISERSLMLVSVLGGAAVMYITMLLIRHKTLHIKFMLGLPIIIALQVCALYYILQYM